MSTAPAAERQRLHAAAAAAVVRIGRARRAAPCRSRVRGGVAIAGDRSAAIGACLEATTALRGTWQFERAAEWADPRPGAGGWHDATGDQGRADARRRRRAAGVRSTRRRTVVVRVRHRTSGTGGRPSAPRAGRPAGSEASGSRSNVTSSRVAACSASVSGPSPRSGRTSPCWRRSSPFGWRRSERTTDNRSTPSARRSTTFAGSAIRQQPPRRCRCTTTRCSRRRTPTCASSSPRSCSTSPPSAAASIFSLFGLCWRTVDLYLAGDARARTFVHRTAGAIGRPRQPIHRLHHRSPRCDAHDPTGRARPRRATGGRRAGAR